MDIKHKLELITLENNTQAHLAKYLLSLDEYQGLTIPQIEKECHVSGQTVTRLCQKLGFKGFIEFKEYMNNDAEVSTYENLRVFINNYFNNDNINEVKTLIQTNNNFTIYACNDFYHLSALTNDLFQRNGKQTFFNSHLNTQISHVATHDDILIIFACDKNISGVNKLITKAKGKVIIISNLEHNLDVDYNINLDYLKEFSMSNYLLLVEYLLKKD